MYCCCNCVKSTSIELIDDTDIYITIPNQEFKNHQNIKLFIDQDFPIGTNSDSKVFIKTDGLKIPIITKRGNFLYADAIKPYKTYLIEAATDTEAFTICNMCSIGKSSHIFPILPEEPEV